MSDLVTYITLKNFTSVIGDNASLFGRFDDKGSVDCTCRIGNQTYRINVARCDGGRNVVIVAREAKGIEYPAIDLTNKLVLTNPDLCKLSTVEKGPTKENEPIWLQIPIKSFMLDAEANTAPGLRVVFGETGCGKSFCCNELAKAAFVGNGHLLAYGDPVEEYITSNRMEVQSPCTDNRFPLFDLDSVVLETRRNKPEDVASIKEFHQDAMRQKPKVILLSELRTDCDIESAIELALTGHKVFATAHAGSLEEGFLRLLKAFKCFAQEELRTPLGRSLHTVIHLEVSELFRSFGPKESQIGFHFKLAKPTIWFAAAKSVRQFVASGVDRVIPSSESDASCRSPEYFADSFDVDAICTQIQERFSKGNDVQKRYKVEGGPMDAVIHELLTGNSEELVNPR